MNCPDTPGNCCCSYKLQLSKPDQRGHATGGLVAAVGVETAVAHGAQATASNAVYTELSQLATRQLINIGKVFSFPTDNRHKGIATNWISISKCFQHISADFKLLRPDGRSQPSQNFSCSTRTHGGHGLPQYACGQSTPAGMCSANHLTTDITEQYWQTIGRHHRAHHARRTRHTGVSIRRRACTSHASSINHIDAVHLIQPRRLRWQDAAQHAPIVLNTLRHILYVHTQVQTASTGIIAVRTLTATTLTQGAQRTDIVRRAGPVWNQQFHTHSSSSSTAAILASIPARASKSAKSSGKATSHSQFLPLTGCTNPRRHACNA